MTSLSKNSVTIGILALVGGVTGFLAMLLVAMKRGHSGFDVSLLMAFRHKDDLARAIGPFWLADAMRDATALGSAMVLSILVLAVIVWLTTAGHRLQAWFLFFAMIGGQALGSVLKLCVYRTRPDVVPHLQEVHTLSFPSGHSMMSAVTYLTLALIACRIAPRPGGKIFAFTLAIFLTLLVGVSRIYLGVHWPSDVFAGWCAGAAWVALLWLVTRAGTSSRTI